MKAGSLEKPEQFEVVDDQTFRVKFLRKDKLTMPDLAVPVPVVDRALPRPGPHGGPADRRRARASRQRVGGRRGRPREACASEGDRAAGAREDPRSRAPLRGLSLRAVGRDVSAGDDRAGPGLFARAAGCRRADHRNRRDHPGGHPRSPPRAGVPQPHGHHPDHSRPRSGGRALRPDRGHARRARGGDGARRRAVRAAPASLHGGSSRRRRAPEPSSPTSCRYPARCRICAERSRPAAIASAANARSPTATRRRCLSSRWPRSIGWRAITRSRTPRPHDAAAHGRVRLRLHHGEHALRPHAQSARSRAGGRRLVGWIRRGAGRGAGAADPGDRHQRIDPGPRLPLRRLRTETHLWPGVAGRRRALRGELRPRGAAGPLGGRPRDRVRRAPGPRSGGPGVQRAPGGAGRPLAWARRGGRENRGGGGLLRARRRAGGPRGRRRRWRRRWQPRAA